MSALRALLTVPVLVALLASPAAARIPDAPAQAASVELVGQTPSVARGGTWSVRLTTDAVPPDSYVQLVVYPRIGSRGEFDETLEGDDLGTPIFPSSRDRLDALPVGADGARVASLPLARSDGTSEVPGAIQLTPGRTYPVEVRVESPTQELLASLLTYLIVLPDDAADVEPLAVAVVADLRASPHLAPDGSSTVDGGELDALRRASAALTGNDTPASLALTPELLDALNATGEEAADVLDGLRAAARDREVLARPYVDLSAQALADDGLGDQLDAQLQRGRTVVSSHLGLEPSAGAWIAERGLGRQGTGLLRTHGVRRVVADAELLEEDDDGSATRTAVLDVPPAGGTAEAIEVAVVDPDLERLLDDRDEPALVAQRIVAALAVSWREQPGASGRGVVVVVDPRRHPDVTAQLLTQLEATGMLAPTTLSDLFDAVEVATDPSDAPIERGLAGEAPEPIGRAVADRLTRAQSLLSGFTAMVGPESARPDALARHMLVAVADGLSGSERRAHVDAAIDEVERTVDAVVIPGGGRITLTARSGTVPLTIRRGTDFPITVRIRLESPKLEFPDGNSRVLVLDRETTRLDLSVRTLASGAFPLDIEVVSPDGSLAVAETRYTVQSTAVSGVGLFLSAGAGLFLAAWWGSHWHRARRSRRLVPRHARRP